MLRAEGLGDTADGRWQMDVSNARLAGVETKEQIPTSYQDNGMRGPIGGLERAASSDNREDGSEV